MKIIFKDEYAKLTGIKSLKFTDDCKVGRNKNEAFNVDTVEVILNDKVIYSIDNKQVKEIVLLEE